MNKWFEDAQDLYTHIEESIRAGELTISPTDSQIAAIAQYQRCKEAYLSLSDLFTKKTIQEWQYKRLFKSRLDAMQAATRNLRLQHVSPDQAEQWLAKGER